MLRTPSRISTQTFQHFLKYSPLLILHVKRSDSSTTQAGYVYTSNAMLAKDHMTQHHLYNFNPAY